MKIKAARSSLLPLSLSTIRITITRMRMQVAGLKKRNLKGRGPHLLVKNDDSNGVGRETENSN